MTLRSEELLDLLGEWAALLTRGEIVWASARWRAQWPELGPGAPVGALEGPLAGVVAALRDLDTTTLQDLTLNPAAQWQGSAVTLPDGRLLLRLKDRRSTARALQRQLDDREQLLFTSRVISVGEMATTLAHELNQPIGAASNLLRGLRMRLSRRDENALDTAEASALDRAVEQLMFASKVIARIREFTHSRQPRQQRVDLAALLRDSAALLDWDLQRSGAALSLEVPGEPVHVRGDAVMLQQVLVNLMRNGLDALRQSPPDWPLLALSLRHEDGQALVEVHDNGCGLSDEVEKNLFVPFASTKPSGMGVGLSICRSFVELHQGRLWFSRNPDRGCTFHIDLPLEAAAEVAPRFEGALQA